MLFSQYAKEVMKGQTALPGTGLLLDHVDYQGVIALMRQILKDDFSFIEEEISRALEQFNSSETYLLNRVQFEALMYLLTNTCEEEASKELRRDMVYLLKRNSIEGRVGFESKHSKHSSRDESLIRQHLQGDSKFAAKNWNLLYCGGSDAVLKELKQYKGQFGIALSVEKFDW